MSTDLKNIRQRRTRLRREISKLPDGPGVYIFRNKSGKILYIGKATSIRDRVRSYLTSDIEFVRSPLIAKMISEARDVTFEQTDSVLEALILESHLIKKYQPPYNTDEKDDKSWNYVVITDEEFPRVFTLRERELGLNQQPTTYNQQQKKLPPKDGSAFGGKYGPYPHGGQLKEALKIIRKIFPFRDRKSKISHNDRFYRQLGLAPDTKSTEAKKEYQKTIRNIKLFFEGKKKKIIKELEGEMKRLAKEREFEKAAEVKKKIFALNHIQDVALIKEDSLLRRSASSLRGSAIRRIEAYDIAHTSGTEVVGVMVVVEGGEPVKSEYRKFKIKEAGAGDVPALKEVLERRLNHSEWPLPRIFVVDGGKAQKNAFEKILETYGISIPVVAAVKDEYHRVRQLLGDMEIIKALEDDIVLANSESHRFAIKFHRERRGKL